MKLTKNKKHDNEINEKQISSYSLQKPLSFPQKANTH